MIKAYILPLSIIMILTFAGCSETVDNNIFQKKTSLSGRTSKTMTVTERAADHLSDKPEQNENGESRMTTISITAGGSVFSATLYDNEAANTLLEQLPVTLDMSELNGNEKFCYLPNRLPTDSEQVGTINIGDLMLYGSDCLVLFYKGFSTSYSYTRLGYIDDPSGFAAALGRGSVKVTFAISD